MLTKLKDAQAAENKYIRLIQKKCVTNEQHREELERYSNIVGSNGRPLATEAEQAFVKFINENVYKDNTTFARVCKSLNIPISKDRSKVEDKIIKKLGGIEAAKEYVNNMHSETAGIIEGKYAEHLDKLNKILSGQ